MNWSDSMKNAVKYSGGKIKVKRTSWSEKNRISKPPIWCAIDLMEGNCALSEVMTQYEKEEYFKMLTGIGIRQINAGNCISHAGQMFVRALRNKGLISESVTIQTNIRTEKADVNAAARALSGIDNVILNVQDTILLRSEEEFPAHKKKTADVLRALKDKAASFRGELTPEYTLALPAVTGTEKISELFQMAEEIFEPDRINPIILNIAPVGEYIMPHVFASMIEEIAGALNLANGGITLSLRPCNDRGTAVSCAELAILAGVRRIEGALFGIGERAGNADIVNLAMNIYSQGTDPRLDLSNIPQLCENFERYTGIQVYDKLPFSGESAFSVFSYSHQNEIAKALDSESDEWNVPYLVINPEDIGRDFSADVIRADGLSGRSAINSILNKRFGLQIPAKLKPEISSEILKGYDIENSELNPEAVYSRFESRYINNTPVFTCPKNYYNRDAGTKTEAVIRLSSGNTFNVKAEGAGRLDAVSNAFKKYFDVDFDIDIYEEHALTTGSASKAVSYVCIKSGDSTYWGVGINDDIIKSSVNALTVAVNQLPRVRNFSVDTDPRLIEMLDYIKDNFETVSLSNVADKFYLSKQYVSKYIKEKSGMTFCENVQKFRMKKAEKLLLTTNMTVESIASESGYPSVEHFNRKFKKLHGITPVQFRKRR